MKGKVLFMNDYEYPFVSMALEHLIQDLTKTGISPNKIYIVLGRGCGKTEYLRRHYKDSFQIVTRK